MFGYIRPFKPYMRFCEYNVYSAFYCGLCKSLGREYGQFFRLMLSYDFAFLSLLSGAYSTSELTITRQRCVIHPLKKRPCLCSCKELEYASAAAVISVYHKICDSINDSKALLSLFFRFMKLIAMRGYKKASYRFPHLSVIVEKQMKEQFRLEREKCSSVDAACEPTAQIMSAIAEGISENEEQKKALSGFGYHLGRFIYIADAFEDIEKDRKTGSYNPFSVTGNTAENAEENAMKNINLTLGMIAEYYSRMNVSKFKEIIDNVVYLGLKNFRLNNKRYLKKLSKKNQSIKV
ncbi:MAG: DUF5685 family protein [Porcipelethomonas sp.]